MDLKARLDEVKAVYEELHNALEKDLPRSNGDPDERLEDLVLLRDTGLVLIGSLSSMYESDKIPFEMDLNELSSIIDDFITTSREVVNA